MTESKARKTLDELRKVVTSMDDQQKVHSKFTSQQLDKVNEQLDKLTTKQPSVNTENTFKAIASIGTGLVSQADNLKSGDPIKITSGILSLVSGVAMCFGPVGMGIGAVTGLVAGIMQMFGSKPSPTLTDVIGDMIEKQTEQIAKMLQDLSVHIDKKFEALSRQITEGFMKLAQDLKVEFEKQKQFNEQLLVSNTSAGAVKSLMESLSYLNGFIKNFDMNQDEDKINKEIDRLLNLVTIKDGVEGIGAISKTINDKLQQLDKFLDVDESKADEAYWLLYDYTIQMTVALINIYIILNTYRYMVLFQFTALLVTVGDKPNSGGMKNSMDNIKKEGVHLLQFLAQPSPNKKHEILISGYIRASLTGRTVDEYLKFCSTSVTDYDIDRSNQISLCDAIPQFNPNNVYAIRSVIDEHNILVTGGVVDEYLFVSSTSNIISDATINRYSLYYQLQQDKNQPWKFTLLGHKIAFNKQNAQIYAIVDGEKEYDKSVLIALPGSEKNANATEDDEKTTTPQTPFILLRSQPGTFFSLDTQSNEHKEEQTEDTNDEELQIAMSLVKEFTFTKNYNANYAMFKLANPRAPIANAKKIAPNSDQDLGRGAKDIIPLLEDPNYTIIDPETAKKIHSMNSDLIDKIIDAFNNKGLSGKYFKKAFDSTKNEYLASGFELAKLIQDASKQLIRTRSQMRINSQLVWEIQSYKPAIDEENERGKLQKKYWSVVNESSKVIIDAVIDTLLAGEAFWCFLTSFSVSFTKFLVEQKEEKSKTSDPNEVKKWLTDEVKLPQYIDVFLENGFESLETIKAEFKDKKMLEEYVQIKKMGHQLTIMRKIAELGGGDEQSIKRLAISVSLDSLDQDLDEFAVFAKTYSEKTKELQDKAGKAVHTLIDTVIGDKGIKEKQSTLIEKQNNYNLQLAEFQRHENMRRNEMNPLYAEKYSLDAAIVTDKVRLDRLNGKIQDYKWAMERAQDYLETVRKQLPFAYNQEVYKEWNFFSSNQKVIQTNRRKWLDTEQKQLKDEKKEDEKQSDEIEKERNKIRARYDKNRASLNDVIKRIEQRNKSYKDAMVTPKGKVEKAFIEWVTANEQIITAIKQTGQSDSNLLDFLNLTNELQPLTVNTLLSVSSLENRMSTLVKNWLREAQVNVPIRLWFKSVKILQGQDNKEMRNKVLNAFKDETYNNMSDLAFKNDVNAYKKKIEVGIFGLDKNKDLKLPGNASELLKKAATDPDHTWVPAIQEIQEDNVRNKFLVSFKPLQEYVNYIKDVIDNANQQLKIVRFDETGDLERIAAVDKVKQIEGSEVIPETT